MVHQIRGPRRRPCGKGRIRPDVEPGGKGQELPTNRRCSGSKSLYSKLKEFFFLGAPHVPVNNTTPTPVPEAPAELATPLAPARDPIPPLDTSPRLPLLGIPPIHLLP